jgi:hypothetical protein
MLKYFLGRGNTSECLPLNDRSDCLSMLIFQILLLINQGPLYQDDPNVEISKQLDSLG